MNSNNFRNFFVMIIILCFYYAESLAKNSARKGSKNNNATPSLIQIRAILGSCKNKTNPIQTSTPEITDCNRRMIIRIKMNYLGEVVFANNFTKYKTNMKITSVFEIYLFIYFYVSLFIVINKKYEF